MPFVFYPQQNQFAGQVDQVARYSFDEGKIKRDESGQFSTKEMGELSAKLKESGIHHKRSENKNHIRVHPSVSDESLHLALNSHGYKYKAKQNQGPITMHHFAHENGHLIRTDRHEHYPEEGTSIHNSKEPK
jgi:hypothetical protein